MLKEPTCESLSPLRLVYCRCHRAWPPEDVWRKRERGQEKGFCAQQLRRVDKALSRAGDIPERSWIWISRRNLILAEDKRCSSWRHGKILSKRPIPERLYAVFDEVDRNSVTDYKSGTNWCNKCSILADKEFASHLMFTPRKQKKWHQKMS